MSKAKEGLLGKTAALFVSAVLAFALVPAVAVGDEADAQAAGADLAALTTSEGDYTAYTATYEGTGSWESLWDSFGSMVYKYFGSEAFVSENADGTYEVVVPFGGESGYSEAITDFVIADEEGGETGTAAELIDDWDGTSDGHAFVFTTSTLEGIHVYIYVGGSMGMGITCDLSLQESGDSSGEENTTEEEDSGGEDDAADDDATTDDATTDDDAATTDAATVDDHGLEIGATYSMDVAYTGTGAYASLQSTLDSMVGGYFGYSVYVTPLSDGTYDIVLYFGGDKGYSAAVEDITYEGTTISQDADTTYTINVPSLSDDIPLSLYVGGSMGMTVTFSITVDVDSAVLVSAADDDEDAAVDKSALKSALATAKALAQGSKSDSAWEALQSAISSAQAVYDDADATQAKVSKAVAALTSAVDTFNNSSSSSSSSSSSTSSTAAEEGWQVGHTYEVPMTFLKENSTETSMSAQYFGDTAIVYVLSDGSLQVTFAATDEGVEQVTAITYNGAVITQNGNQFTFVIPASDVDVAISLGMTIKAMTLLGVGEQMTDLYLYLTQAVDLGTGLEGMEASSSNTTLADAGDGRQALEISLVGIAVAALGMCRMARHERRRGWE